MASHDGVSTIQIPTLLEQFRDDALSGHGRPIGDVVGDGDLGEGVVHGLFGAGVEGVEDADDVGAADVVGAEGAGKGDHVGVGPDGELAAHAAFLGGDGAEGGGGHLAVGAVVFAEVVERGWWFRA